MSKTYIMEKFKKLGFSYVNVKRITNPFNVKFNFISDKRKVKIERTEDVLPSYCHERLLIYLLTNPIKPQTCHSTAPEIASYFRDLGVQVCDGFYYDIKEKKTYAHTFCKLGDKYFDPTLEFAYSFDMTNCFDYISERVFDPNEFSILQHAYSYILGGNGLMRYCCSSVCSGYHKDSGLFYEVSVNDDGYIVYLPSPYKSQIAA
jgi:hypothetical protein